MADVQDIARARRALARADRVLGALARRYVDVVDDNGYEPGVDQAAIHWPEAWLRQASPHEIFAWIAHHALAWALGHDWRIPGIPLADYYETLSRWWSHPRVQLPRMASLIETSCVLYFSGRRPRGWRPLIDPKILERWRGIPAEAILLHLRNIPDRMTYEKWLARGPMDKDSCDADGDPDGNEHSDAGGDPDADLDAEADDAADSNADGDAATILEAISDGDGDIDGDTDADADGDGNSDTGTDGGSKTDADGDGDGDNDRDGSGSHDSDADSDADAIVNEDGDACDVGADGRGDQPAPVSWRVPLSPPPEPVWVPTFILATEGTQRPDYLRHHRRHAASPVVIPARRGDGVIVVSRDCSGSISHDQIEAETVAIRALRAAHPAAELILIDHDSKIARVVDDPSDEDLALRPCDGGTDFRPVFAEADRLELSGTRIACLVLISDDLDGCMPYHDEEPRYPVVWLTSRCVRASVPFGEVIRYD